MENKNSEINVVYSSSNLYCWVMCVSLLSLLENNKNYFFNVYILSNNISESNISKIYASLKEFNCEINIIDISAYKEKIGNIPIHARRDFATFGRLFEAEILPISIHKVIHIDCDTIINGDISDIWNCDISNKIVAGVCDCLSKRYLKVMQAAEPNYILNAGVLVFNLDMIRKQNLVQKFNEYINSHKRIMYLDQDVLNACVPYKDKHILDPKFNSYSLFHYLNYMNIINLRHPYNFYTKNQVEEARSKPIIIHFTTSNFDCNRPWYTSNHHPYRDKFLYYLKKSAFRDHELINKKASNLFKLSNKLPLFFRIKLGYLVNGILKPTLFKNR